MSISNALVVDDSRLARIALAKLLKSQNIIVDMASSGEEAIRVASETMPDVIFMDFMMPDMDGYETTRKITQTDAISEIPVVMCTSQDTEEDRKKARDSGAKGFLTKPTTQEILNKVIEALNRRQKDAAEAPIAAAKITKEQSSKSEVQTQISIDQIKSVAKHAAEQVAIKSAQEAGEKAAQKVASIAAEDAITVAMNELESRVRQQAEEAASGCSEAIAEQVADKTAREVVRDIVDDLAEKALADIGDKVESSMTESLQRELNACLEEFLKGDRLRGEVSDISREISEMAVNEIAERVARSTAEEAATVISERISESTATEIAKVFSRSTSEEMVNKLFEEKAKDLTSKAVKIGLTFSIISIAAAGALAYFLPTLIG